MGKFEEYLEGFDRSADADLNTVFADLTTAHTDDLSIRDAAVSERDARLAQLEADNLELKARNYDLLIKASAPVDSTGVIADPDEPDSSDITTEDLFETK